MKGLVVSSTRILPGFQEVGAGASELNPLGTVKCENVVFNSCQTVLTTDYYPL